MHLKTVPRPFGIFLNIDLQTKLINMSNFTRGSGLLEGFLSRKRATKANELIGDNVHKGKILDIGCGSVPYFLKNTKFKEKYGIDPSLKSINSEGIKLIKGDFVKGSFNLPKNYFNIVTMLAVFEHIDNESLGPVLKNILSLLASNGKLIITTPAPWADKLLHVMAYVGLISKEEIHEHKHNHKRKSIEEMLRQNGFKNVKSGFFELGFNMWFSAEK